MADVDISQAQHPAYTAALDRWQTCRDLFGGSKAIKAAGTRYLPRLGKQSDQDYEAYKTRALFFNGYRRTVAGLTGTAFGTPPAVEAPDAVKAHLSDVTLAGEPFASFAPSVVAEILKIGRRGVLLDYADRASRPYWVPYDAEAIPLWDTLTVNGDNILTFLVLKECEQVRDGFAVKATEKYRVCELVLDEGAERPRYQVTMWTKVSAQGASDKWIAGPPVTPLRLGAPLSFIPFVFFGPFGITPSIDDPPLMDVGDVLLSHYRSSADLEHGRHYTALPTPVVTGTASTAPLSIGSSSAWVLPEAGAKAEYLEFKGLGLQSLEKALADKERLATILGSRLLESQKVAPEAAATVAMRHAGDDATLQTIVGAASLGLTMLLRMHAWWAGASQIVDDPKVSVALNTEFVTPAIPLDALSLLAEADKISFATLYYNLGKAGLTRPGVTAEQERQQILAEGGADPMAPRLPAPEPEVA